MLNVTVEIRNRNKEERGGEREKRKGNESVHQESETTYGYVEAYNRCDTREIQVRLREREIKRVKQTR